MYKTDRLYHEERELSKQEMEQMKKLQYIFTFYVFPGVALIACCLTYGCFIKPRMEPKEANSNE